MHQKGETKAINSAEDKRKPRKSWTFGVSIGNASDSCAKRSYPVGYYEILGYGISTYRHSSGIKLSSEDSLRRNWGCNSSATFS
jgi:hypothetical protein